MAGRRRSKWPGSGSGPWATDGSTDAEALADLVGRWCEEAGVAPELRPTPAQLEAGFFTSTQHSRIGTDLPRLLSWERRFGYELPASLKAWLRLSDGFYGEGGPLVHPLGAIGPMIPFARMPGVIIQPESWFELGNPNLETVCIDLAYRWPGGESPLFTSGDDQRGSPPKIIATGFTSWFLRLLHRGGVEYWFEPSFIGLGDPWQEHRRRVPPPTLPDRLGRLVPSVRPMLDRGLDDRAIAERLALPRADVEALLRHAQHAPADYARGRCRVAGSKGTVAVDDRDPRRAARRLPAVVEPPARSRPHEDRRRHAPGDRRGRLTIPLSGT